MLTIVWWLHTPLLLPSSFVFGRLDQFVVGAIVGQLARETPGHGLVRFTRAPLVLPAALGGLFLLGTYHGATLGLANNAVMDALLHPLFGLLTAIVLLRLLTAPSARTLPAERTLAWFGTISFGLYLWHYPILDQGLRWTRASVPLPSPVATLLAVPVLCALAVAAAKLSFVLIERPFSSRRNRTDPPNGASTLAPWPSPRSWESRPSTA